MNHRVASTVLFVALLASPGCGPGGSNGDGNSDGGASTDGDVRPASDADRRSATLEIGVLDDHGGLDPIEEGEDVEITVGFQGLIFIDFALAGPAEMPSRFSGTARVDFLNKEADFTRRKSRLRFSSPTEGRRLLRRFRIPFSDLSVARDSTIRLTVELHSGEWTARGSARFHAVDRERGTAPPPDAGADSTLETDAS